MSGASSSLKEHTFPNWLPILIKECKSLCSACLTAFIPL